MTTAEELGTFMLNYYKGGGREHLGDALLCAPQEFGQDQGTDPCPRYFALYFFARVARLDSTTLTEYRQLLQDLQRQERPPSPGQRDFLETVCWLACEDRPGRPPYTLPDHFPADFDVLDRPVRTLADLDYLWTEFSVTGRPEPVLKIVDVVRGPDRIRAQLQRWLERPATNPLAVWRRQRALRKLARVAGITCDPEARTIAPASDLDCLCTVGPRSEREYMSRFPLIRTALPFLLGEDDIAYVMTKGAARWSLLSLTDHAVVRDLWRTEMPEDVSNPDAESWDVVHQQYQARLTKTASAPKDLLPKWRAAWIASVDWFVRALRALRNRITPRPLGPKPRTRAETGLNTLISLSTTTALRNASAPSNWRDLLVASSESARKASAYCSITLLKDLCNDRLRDNDHVLGRWRLDFVRPNRYHVTQWLVLDDSTPGDLKVGVNEWVSIGEENYDNCALWVRTENRKREKLNRRLSMDGTLDLLDITRTVEPITACVYRYLQEQYLLLDYDMPPPLPDSVMEDLEHLPWHLQVWIDLNGPSVAKSQVTVRSARPEGAPINLELHNAFACYNERVRVDPPPWLNAVPDASGNLTIVSNSIPILPHYD